MGIIHSLVGFHLEHTVLFLSVHIKQDIVAFKKVYRGNAQSYEDKIVQNR